MPAGRERRRRRELGACGVWEGVGFGEPDRRVTGRRGGGWRGYPGLRACAPARRSRLGEGAVCWTLASGPSAFSALPWDPAASRPRLFPALPLALGCSPSPTVPRIPEPPAPDRPDSWLQRLFCCLHSSLSLPSHLFPLCSLSLPPSFYHPASVCPMSYCSQGPLPGFRPHS